MRELSLREKRTVRIGLVAGVAIALINWVVLPVQREWAELGDQLAPVLARLEALKGRAERHELLLARRAHLAGRLGSLTGRSDAASSESPQLPGKGKAVPDSEGSPPAGGQDQQSSLEAELEKAVKQAGGTHTVISAGRTQRRRTDRYFRRAAPHVEMQVTIEALVKVLHGLENGARFIRIDALRLHRDLQNNPKDVKVDLDIVAYESVPAS